jgi:serine O-acetyltransferase
VIIHKRSIIGNNVIIGSNVTIGGRSGLIDVPIIGDNVYIATGAKILGNVKVGNYAVIGANAVVIKDVPENAIVGGVPAKILSLKGGKEYLDGLH